MQKVLLQAPEFRKICIDVRFQDIYVAYLHTEAALAIYTTVLIQLGRSLHTIFFLIILQARYTQVLPCQICPLHR